MTQLITLNTGVKIAIHKDELCPKGAAYFYDARNLTDDELPKWCSKAITYSQEADFLCVVHDEDGFNRAKSLCEKDGIPL